MALHEFKNGRWVMFTPDFSNVEESRRKKAMQISGYYREEGLLIITEEVCHVCMLIEYEIESCLGLCLDHNNGGQGQVDIEP